MCVECGERRQSVKDRSGGGGSVVLEKKRLRGRERGRLH